jgi:hypothetical protein
MDIIIEKAITCGVGGVFSPIFRFFGCVNERHVDPISTASASFAIVFELIASIFLFAGIAALEGGMCCLKPNPKWEKTNETVVADGLVPGWTGGFKCNGFQLDFAGAGADDVDLSFAPRGFGQCQVDFPIYDNTRVGNCQAWTDADTRSCWRKTYHIDATPWSAYDTAELCSQRGSERYFAEWKGGMITLAWMKFGAFLVQSAAAAALHRAVERPEAWSGPIEIWRLLHTASAAANIMSGIIIAVLVDLCGEIYPGHPSYYVFTAFQEHDRMAFLGRVRTPRLTWSLVTAHRPRRALLLSVCAVC